MQSKITDIQLPLAANIHYIGIVYCQNRDFHLTGLAGYGNVDMNVSRCFICIQVFFISFDKKQIDIQVGILFVLHQFSEIRQNQRIIAAEIFNRDG